MKVNSMHPILALNKQLNINIKSVNQRRLAMKAIKDHVKIRTSRSYRNQTNISPFKVDVII